VDQLGAIYPRRHRRALPARVPDLDPERLHCDDLLPADRISDGAGPDAGVEKLAQHPVDAGDLAILDLVPVAGLCLDGADGQEFLVQRDVDRWLEFSGAAGLGGEIHPDDAHQFRRRAGDGLHLPAVHDPALVCQS